MSSTTNFAKRDGPLSHLGFSACLDIESTRPRHVRTQPAAHVSSLLGTEQSLQRRLWFRFHRIGPFVCLRLCCRHVFS